ncbi:hypothetical protein Dda_7317 [Drechslerella dactyloides]|uniref:Nitrogen regulatory protein areA GATA-like domain-containing protein n=1 Tax=Drechslerella dactyloides TaxID=74499 RepID=A0AAD6IW87_DREDA|nr:hypothetical protein Dda_7317 [Drechslerella dactyloides]
MMNHGLPQIVDSRQSLTEDIRKIDKVQVEELTRLWKGYGTTSFFPDTTLDPRTPKTRITMATSRADVTWTGPLRIEDAGTYLLTHLVLKPKLEADTIPDGIVYTTNKNIMATGRRLENLFWRIWGSDRIQENISGSTVAKIFLMIDAGEKAIQNQAYRIPPPPETVIKQVPIDISVPPTPPPSPFSAFSPSNNVLHQPSQTALSASLLQAYPNTPPSPMMPPKVPPPSPVVSSDHPVRPPLTRVHQSYPLSTNDEQVQIGREMVSSKAASNSGRHRRRNIPGILRTSKADGKRRMGPPTISRTTSNSSNATASSGISTPMTSITEITNLQDASKGGKDTDDANSFASGPSAASSSRKGSEIGSAKSKEDWLVEPDFRAKYIEQRKKDRLSAIAGNPIVKGPLKTNATIATAPMTALATPRTKKGRGRNILVVDSVAPLKSPDNSSPAATVVETVSASISEGLPGLVEKETFEKPVFQRTKSQLSLMIEQAKRNADGGILDEDPAHASLLERNDTPEVIPEEKVQSDDGFEDEEDDDKPLEMRQRPPPKKTSKTKRPKFRSRKS